ncbi:MAG: FAD-dependent oxidoreductase, partial [Mailhella sp.]
KALAAGQCDLVAMARASLADPYLPAKVAECRSEDISRCIGCLQGCIGEFAKGHIVRCMVNPMTGMEGEYDLSPVSSPRRVFIAGGGVTGCEAAIAAAMRGHHVTLFEKSDRLGGQWLAAAVPPGKEEFLSFSCWQKRKLAALGVSIRLNTPLTKEIVDSEKPDAVLIATGSHGAVPPIKGREQSHVVFANDVLLGKVRTGKNVVVIGGGMVGVETADFLSAYGKNLTVVEMLSAVAAEAEPNSKYFLMQRIKKQNVRLITEARVQEITENAVRVLLSSGEEVLLPAESVVLAAGLRSEASLAAELEGCGAELSVIGDARKVKNGLFNIQEGFEAGLNV